MIDPWLVVAVAVDKSFDGVGYIAIVAVDEDDNAVVAVVVDHRGLTILARIIVAVRDKVDDDRIHPSVLGLAPGSEGVDVDLD